MSKLNRRQIDTSNLLETRVNQIQRVLTRITQVEDITGKNIFLLNK